MAEGKQVLVQGRIVWTAGSTPFTGSQKKDNQGRPVVDDKGQPVMQYGFGLAVPMPHAASTPDEIKNFNDIWNAVHTEAAALYASGQPPRDFSYKYKNGNDVDHRGVPFANRTGYKDHIVYALTTSLPLKFVKWNGAYQEVKDGIKCGDYVQVQVNVKGHTPKPNTQGKPGLYLNPNLTLFLGYGDEIINTPDAASVFGAAPPPLPNGASATPTVSAAPNFAQFGQAPQVPQQPAAPQVPQWNGQANPAVLPPQFQQQPPMQQAPQVPQQQFAPPPPQQFNPGPQAPQFNQQQPQWQPPQQPAAPQMGNGQPVSPAVPPTPQWGTPQNTAPNAFPSNGGVPPWTQR